MAKPVTKWAVGIQTPEEIPGALERAFTEATTGRPGPVLLDIPMDVQRGIIEDRGPGPTAAHRAPAVDIGPLLAAIARSKRPLILAGGGLRAGRAVAVFRRLADALGIPVVHSLMGADVLPFAHPCRVGMIGTYGNRWANLAMMSCDLLIVLGSRLDVRQTGSRTETFARGRTVFHVDCEAGEINNRVRNCHGVVSEVAPFLEQMVAAYANTVTAGRYDPWPAEIAELRRAYADTAELGNLPGINPNVFMHQLSRQSQDAGAYVVDVGQHQMWAAQSLELGPEQRLLTSGGMGSMGFALPAAIGASLCMSGRPVTVIAGDGGFQCNIQELQTVSRLNLPLKIVVANNRCHGMVRQFQESYFGARYQSTFLGYSAPDFSKVSSAYGIESITVDGAEDVDVALRWLWRNPERPQLLQVMINTFANAYPKVAFGQPVSEMESCADAMELVPEGS
jgi:acetolactate synthase-1/2/3 large subunit